MHRIPFKQHQREELLGMGIAAEAIDLIEAEALPWAKQFLTRPPRKADVLAELHDLQKKLTEARNGIERVLDAPRSVPLVKEVQVQLIASQGRYSLGGLRLDRTSQALADALKLVTARIDQIPPGPLRHRSADPYPIKVIHEALQHGSIRAGDEPEHAGPKPSASPASVFRRTIGICYEAIDAKHADPERALKEYMKRWRELEKHLESVGLGTERTRKT